MTPGAGASIPTLLFGAFDRHNFGDLLFPHVAAALLPGQHLIFAGLAERDLRGYGGHRVRSLARLAVELGGQPVNLVHVGGELLTCDAWQAAIMLLPPEEAQATIRHFERRPAEQPAWLRERLGLTSLAPYTIPRSLFPKAARVTYNAVGGVDLLSRDAALRAEVAANLQAADEVNVRDRQTLAGLRALAIPARLVPDSAVMVAKLFGKRIREHAEYGEVGAIRHAFPRGYLAIQFSADFGDDATLAAIADQLDQVAMSTGHAVVFFRAGAAPWHDDLACYRRTASRMRAQSIGVFESLDIWDICALIAHSQSYCGSSLHGRIVAGAFALPRVSLLHPSLAGQPAKQTAYAATWEPTDLHALVAASGMAEGRAQALTTDPERLRGLAGEMVGRYEAGGLKPAYS